MTEAENHQDQRIAKRADGRADRVDRTISDSRENTDVLRGEQRRAMLRDVNTLLPVPPDLPGFHQIWLTTTNNKDSIEQRMRLGYTLVHPNEHPGFMMNGQKMAEASSDRIMVNEMVLAKIPRELFEEDMIYLHHDMPFKMARSMSEEAISKLRDGKGNSVGYVGDGFMNGLSDGMQGMAQSRRPIFTNIG